ncbi:protein HEXIM1 [Anthonomus grandis grandis]|uniref:protein HEXIM1 n=1 Tax=Anthonomus grandis grandis TaxID=2921223 RepID=UPI002165BF62|nr:protein HEXIM1 [Anthonomus grandis grandis]
MDEISEKTVEEMAILKSVDAVSQKDGVQKKGARATHPTDQSAKMIDGDATAPRRRRTRRGKSKRKAPYQKYGNRKSHVKMLKPRIVKPEAPHNDNQFLLEDHGGFEELDERLKNIDQASTSSITRTRDSSFSVDSDGEEFYSSPDDEDEFLMQDFNDQYKSIQTEQLQTMSKQELIEEYLALDNRTSQKNKDLEESILKLKEELDKQIKEKEQLRQENELLRKKLEQGQENSDSEDSDSDSSDSCSSSSTSLNSSGSERSRSPIQNNKDYGYTNGHTSPPQRVDAV